MYNKEDLFLADGTINRDFKIHARIPISLSVIKFLVNDINQNSVNIQDSLKEMPITENYNSKYRQITAIFSDGKYQAQATLASNSEDTNEKSRLMIIVFGKDTSEDKVYDVPEFIPNAMNMSVEHIYDVIKNYITNLYEDFYDKALFIKDDVKFGDLLEYIHSVYNYINKNPESDFANYTGCQVIIREFTEPQINLAVFRCSKDMLVIGLVNNVSKGLEPKELVRTKSMNCYMTLSGKELLFDETIAYFACGIVNQALIDN